MAGLSPNSTNISRTKRAINAFSHLVVHPEYEYWRVEWSKIRDALAGEREIKRKGELYLRPMEGSEPEQYFSYLDRAVFYNMSGQTLNGMVGQVFRRPPTIRNMPVVGGIVARNSEGASEVIATPTDLLTKMRRFAKDGTSFQGFSKTAVAEQIGLGRFGALADVSQIPTSGEAQPFVVGYTAENIIDWEIGDINGFFQVQRILLREFERQPGNAPSQNNKWIGAEGATVTKNGRPARVPAGRGKPVDPPTISYSGGYTYGTIYRELLLEPQSNGSLIYVQRLFREDPTGIPYQRIVPMVRGNPLNFIPFVFFGAASNAADVEKPPLLDIVDLNLKHYRTYAELEHGRFYTSLPTYYAPGAVDSDTASYHIGPGKVWEVPSGEIPGIMEYKGEGLGTLERALNEKEQQIAAIGGRLMPGMSKSVSESDNQATLRDANEQSLLLNVMLSHEDGMTTLVRYWLMFRDVPLSQTETLRFELDATFLTTAVDARSIRAFQQLYSDGILPIDSLYECFIRNGLVPSSQSLEEFTRKMNDPRSFIGQPDVSAMRRGYANRAQELEQDQRAREADFQQQELDHAERQIRIEERKLAIAAAVDSTSVAASRKLGDPEGAAPSQAEAATIAVQAKAVASKPKPSGV